MLFFRKKIIVISFSLVVVCIQIVAQDYHYEWLSLGMSESPSSLQRIRWRTSVDMPVGFVEFTEAKASPVSKVGNEKIIAVSHQENDYGRKMIYHQASLADLIPGKKYVYRIGDGNQNWSEWFQFTTAKNTIEPFSFIYISDVQVGIHDHYPRVIRNATTKVGEKASFMMFTGDMTSGAHDSEWSAFFKANGWLFAMKPVVAIPDSHEYSQKEGESKSTLTTFWSHLFSYPENTKSELLALGNYYFDYQGCRFIMINTRELESGSKEYIATLLSWMEDLLAKNQNKWCIVGQHRPVYSVAHGRNSDKIRDYLKPLYDKYNVDLVLSGHDHIYARMRGLQNDRQKSETVGPVYVVSIAGSQVYMPEYYTYIERMASNTQLFHNVTIDNEKLNFKSWLATGELYDEFEIIKTRESKLFIDKTPSVEEILDLPEYTWQKYTEEDKENFRKKSKIYKSSK